MIFPHKSRVQFHFCGPGFSGRFFGKPQLIPCNRYTIQGRTLLPPLRTWSELAGIPPIVLRQHVLGQAPGLRRNPVVFQRYGAVFPPRRESRYNSEQEKCMCQQRRQAGIHIRRYTLAYQQTPPFSYMIYQANVYQHRIYS